MPTFVVEVEFEVYCETCGSGLCHQSTGNNSTKRNYPQVRVQVCEECLQAAKEEAKEEGFDSGAESRDGELSEKQWRIEELEFKIKELEKEYTLLEQESLA